MEKGSNEWVDFDVFKKWREEGVWREYVVLVNFGCCWGNIDWWFCGDGVRKGSLYFGGGEDVYLNVCYGLSLFCEFMGMLIVYMFWVVWEKEGGLLIC